MNIKKLGLFSLIGLFLLFFLFACTTKPSIEINIHFDSNGGSQVESFLYEGEQNIVNPLNPSKEGHDFLGWYFDNYTFQNPFTVNPLKEKSSESDITIYAKWVISTYMITYILDGGNENTANPNSFTYNTESFTLASPIKEGNTFRGWFLESDFSGNQVHDFEVDTLENITLYAKWENNPYQISYYQNESFDPNVSNQLLGNETILAISLGHTHSYALTSLSRIFTWGENAFGQLGDGTTIDKFVPSDITSQFELVEGETISSVVSGGNYAFVLTSLNRVFSWGENTYGQLADGTNTNRLLPFEITNHFDLEVSETIINVSLGGNHGAALTSTGNVFMWGYNNFGQLGDDTIVSKSEPIKITSSFNLETNEDIVEISIGEFHSAAFTSLGRVFTWGDNTYGQLGDSSIINRLTPVDMTNQFTLDASDLIISVSLGGFHSSALTSFGKIFFWGQNVYGQLGDGRTLNKNVPTDTTHHFYLELGETIVSTTLGLFNSSAISSSGRLFIWGDNTYGQLGDRATTNRNLPFDITFRFDLEEEQTLISASLGGGHSSAISSSGKVYIWGYNSLGQLGDRTSTNNTKPTILNMQYQDLVFNEIYDYTSPIIEFVPELEGYTYSGWYVDTKMTILYVFDRMPAHDLNLYSHWTILEYSIHYHLDGGTNDISNPISYNINTDTIQLNSAVKEGHIFLGWYDNLEYTGDGIISISKGTINDVYLYAKWEVAAYDVDYYVFQNETLLNINLGSNHSAALTISGRLFTWGNNQSGQLGIGSVNHETNSTPNDITDKFNLAVEETIVSVSLGSKHTAVVTSLGRMFTWGSNINGKLGIGSNSNDSFPTPIEITNRFNLANGEMILEASLGGDYSAVITSLGRIFTWGANHTGQLGDGSTTKRITPKDITNQFNLEDGETIKELKMGMRHSIVLTSAGRVFSFGHNAFGQLGDGSIVNKLVPTNVTNLFGLDAMEKITKLSVGENHSAAITSSGRMFVWGSNNEGQLGDGSRVDRLLPKDITWNFNLVQDEKISISSLGGENSSALTSTGRIFVWGSNSNGQLTENVSFEVNMNRRTSPHDITQQFILLPGEVITNVVVAGKHSSVITSTNRLFTWGYNFYGQLGYDYFSSGVNRLINIIIPTEVLLGHSHLVKTETFDFGSPLVEYMPVLDGYTFSGWFVDDQMTIPYIFGLMPANHVNLYGYWMSDL